MYVVAPRVALKKAAGTGYTVLSKWPFSHSSMERSLRYLCRNTTRWMGCRNINISVALTYQLLRLIGLSLVWRCLSRGVVCTFNHLLRRYGAVAALGARPQGLTERRSLRTQIFSKSVKKWMSHWEKESFTTICSMFHLNTLLYSILTSFVESSFFKSGYNESGHDCLKKRTRTSVKRKGERWKGNVLEWRTLTSLLEVIAILPSLADEK